ncbi:Dihydroorotate dehydrogenase B (NAD(+)), electron transfer subunit [Lentibacillus sp. JNUCC-1]|uniref:dihydroorotate dehydrogenase electron transfer subunit n=1 Tax=Lentibacillus sp. JNUCC-1 TaxID=2654513 RepID=UPI0012E8587A|nr:dihydroorotate dehydrogenase electron transfer subunit [Lentibacillus sp. JNUCC-1]MUV40031.1 Dihydroorotate dehydrogenase B (NAD(+)), electron transfer subunit [Lentibacillus sp. JNUCC-1]
MKQSVITTEYQKHVSDFEILSLKKVAYETFELIMSNRYISQKAEPGQFLHVILEGHMLARPLSIADVDKVKETVTLLFKINGQGTKTLACLAAGSILRGIGPLGKGFPLDVHQGKDVLLVGGGIGIPPLYYLAKTLYKKGVSITSVLGYQSKSHVFYESEFNTIGNTIIMTNDGTYGEKGFVTDKLSGLGHIDRYYSCGPIQMLRAVQKTMQNTKGFLSIEERMGCGVGTCMACVIPSHDGGYRKICTDGPVFSAEEVYL